MSVYAGECIQFEHKGRDFLARIHHDGDTGAPWEEHDGHVSVRRVSHDYGSRWGDSKAPSEWVFHRGDRREWSYCVDMRDAMKTALRDGWGIAPDALAKLSDQLGRTPTRREIARAAVLADVEFLRGWVADEWHWAWVEVMPIGDDGEPDETQCETLGGCESCGDYVRDEILPQLADAIADRMETEETEAEYWAARDVVTEGD